MPMEYVELARARSRRGEVVLRERHDPDHPNASVVELRVNGVFVMDTLETASEQALASVALLQVEDPRSVLVGGLGLGFTAHTVLADDRVQRLEVAEIEESLVRWMRDGTVPHGPAFLADGRLSVRTADIAQVVATAAPETYDLVLLDVDNGPGFLTYDDNAALYGGALLHVVAETLRPGGALAVWSSAEAPALHGNLAEVFGAATPVPYDVRLQGRDERYWLYLARR